MSVARATKQVPPSAGAPFNMGTLRDSVGPVEWDAAVVLDPLSGSWARIEGTADSPGRLATSSAQAVLTVVGAQYNLTVGSGANVTLTVPAGATHAYITVDPASAGNYLRYTYNGTNPSTTIGHTLAPQDGDWFMNLAVLEFSGDGGAMTIHVTYFQA